MPDQKIASAALPAAIHTLPELMANRVAATPQGEAFRQFDPRSGQWQGLSCQELDAQVQRWRRAIATLGLAPGSRLAMLLPNGIDAVCFDLATLCDGHVPVPLHAIDTPGAVAYILNDCQAAVLVTSRQAQWDAIRAAGTQLPHLQQVVLIEGVSHAAEEAATTVVGLDEWLAAAHEQPLPQTPPRVDDLAAIVYTSGTTGRPKGVMLTHGNIVENVRGVIERILPTREDVFLSFLPLSHTFERTPGYYLPLAMGATVVFARSVAQLAEDFRIVQPTVLMSVPRIYERIYAKIQDRLARGPAWRRHLFDWAVEVGWRRFCRAQGLPTERSARAWLDPLVWPLLERLVAAPLREQFGGRMRVAISGGAALGSTVSRCFIGLGLPLLQGYGMTETSPVISVNALDDNHPATVGRPFSNVQIRIGDNDELQVRGATVMKGYWGRPAETAAVLDAEGWLATGDQADLSDGGRIRIKGRIKEIIVTSTGEKVPPADLELAITTDPLFEQAFVVGENRPFIAAIVVLAAAEWERLARALDLDPADPASLGSRPAREAVLKRVRAATADFPHYGVPRNVALTLEPWTVDNELMTPTLKLKRPQLRERFAETISGLYAAHRRP